MSREAYEQSEAAWIEENTYKGLGDPDLHGHYPGQMNDYESDCPICHPVQKGSVDDLHQHQQHINELKKGTQL